MTIKMGRMTSKAGRPRKHLVIPDVQAKAGTPVDHLTACGNYIIEKRPDVVVHLGDHWDMPSLSSYDAGKRQFEGRRYKLDIEAGNTAMLALMAPIQAHNRRASRKTRYWPEFHFLLGNHEHRIERATETDAKFHGLIGFQDFNLKQLGWKVHDFLRPFVCDGIAYAHYFYNPMTGKPYGGACQAKLKNIGRSFTMGHVQGLDHATRYLPTGERHMGLVAGSFYQHDEDYKGPQANHHWRGIVVKHEVMAGAYDPMYVSLNYLLGRYR